MVEVSNLDDLGDRIERTMDEKDLSRKEFVREIGYRNDNKGLRRLDHWIDGKEFPNDQQIEMLVEVLPESAEELQCLREFCEKAADLLGYQYRRRDDQYYLYVQKNKYSSTVRELPDDYSLEEAIDEAKTVVRRLAENKPDRFTNYLVVSLNTPQSKTYYFNPDGSVHSVKEPSFGPDPSGLNVDGKLISFA